MTKLLRVDSARGYAAARPSARRPREESESPSAAARASGSPEPTLRCIGEHLRCTGERPSTRSGRPEPAEGRKPFPVVQTRFDEIEGQFSPDGRSLAYASNESGRYEIYIRPFPEPSGKWQVSTAGGTQPRWRRDGRFLMNVAEDAAVTSPITIVQNWTAGLKK